MCWSVCCLQGELFLLYLFAATISPPLPPRSAALSLVFRGFFQNCCALCNLCVLFFTQHSVDRADEAEVAVMLRGRRPRSRFRTSTPGKGRSSARLHQPTLEVLFLNLAPCLRVFPLSGSPGPWRVIPGLWMGARVSPVHVLHPCTGASVAR